MLVYELIAKLSALDPNTDVAIRIYEEIPGKYEYYPITVGPVADTIKKGDYWEFMLEEDKSVVVIAADDYGD
jgi:hypothetical protein